MARVARCKIRDRHAQMLLDMAEKLAEQARLPSKSPAFPRGYERRSPRVIACHCVIEAIRVSHQNIADIEDVSRRLISDRWSRVWTFRDGDPQIDQLCHSIIDELKAFQDAV